MSIYITSHSLPQYYLHDNDDDAALPHNTSLIALNPHHLLFRNAPTDPILIPLPPYEPTLYFKTHSHTKTCHMIHTSTTPRALNNLRYISPKACTPHTNHLPISLGLFHKTLVYHYRSFPSSLLFNYVCLMVTSLTSICPKPTLKDHHGNLGEVQQGLIVNTRISTQAWDLPMPLPQSCRGWEVRYDKQDHAMPRCCFVTPQNVFLTSQSSLPF